MRNILASLVIAVAAIAFLSSEASAWVCYASSPSANGWGSAVVECALQACTKNPYTAAPYCGAGGSTGRRIG